jgi:prepilin-type processing-associated H-X9-DG protein
MQNTATAPRQFTLKQLLLAMFIIGLVSALLRISVPLTILLFGLAALGANLYYRWLTVVESLATAGIILLVIALLLPTLRYSRHEPHSTVCRNHLKNIALALQNYHDIHGSFPPAYTVDANGRRLHSWRVLILPFLEQSHLYAEFRLDEPWDSPHNLPLAKMMPPLYACPSHPDRKSGITNYVAIVGDETIWPGERSVSVKDVGDGAKLTLQVVEWPEGNILWTSPQDLTFPLVATSWRAGSAKHSHCHHEGRVNVVFADGRTAYLQPEALSISTLRAWLTRAGNETVPAE